MLNRGGGKCRYLLVPRLNYLGTRPQEQSSLETVNWTDHAQCMQMNSIDMGLYYDSTVTLTCKLLFAAAKAIFDVGPDVSLAVIGHRLLDWFPDPSSEGESGEGSGNQSNKCRLLDFFSSGSRVGVGGRDVVASLCAT